MKIEEAIALANRVKPRPRIPLDKLQRSPLADQHAAGVAALAKRYDGMSDTAASMQKRLDQASADIALIASVMKVKLDTVQ